MTALVVGLLLDAENQADAEHGDESLGEFDGKQ